MTTSEFYCGASDAAAYEVTRSDASLATYFPLQVLKYRGNGQVLQELQV